MSNVNEYYDNEPYYLVLGEDGNIIEVRADNINSARSMLSELKPCTFCTCTRTLVELGLYGKEKLRLMEVGEI